MEAKREVKKVMREVEEEALTLVLTPDEVRQLRLMAGGSRTEEVIKSMRRSAAISQPLTDRDRRLLSRDCVHELIVRLISATAALGGEVP
jgi:hypothetical protein